MANIASQELPTGTVTFLFTDIEGSTKLWEQAPERTMYAMAVHDKIIESHVANTGGMVVRPRGEGDSRFAVFKQAKKALLAATAIQRTLYAEPWETPRPLRVRIALHTGEADLRMGDYYGSAVNRCARIRGIAYGGQTLLSRTTWELVQDTAPSVANFFDHGEHHLKDLARPEHIFELVVPGVPFDFPPLKSLPDEIALEPPAFLEAEVEPDAADDGLFVARERELERLDGFLAKALDGQGQVVFVHGEAGQGKSSLLEAFSRRAQTALPDLIVARGICDVYTGVGDPFLPFRDVLSMLTGDVESLWRAGNISRSHALRLWNLIPQAVEALTTVGKDLIDTLVPGSVLVSRVAAFATDETEWLKRLREQIRLTETSGGGQAPEQSRLFEEYAAVLSTLATRQPLLLILDDLHWADLSSISLLAHLGRRLADSPILIIGAYRPEDVDQGRDGQSHPLTSVLSEFKRLLGNIWLDLDQGAVDEARDFVDALLDAEPNVLKEDFRQAFATHTKGQALFAIELLRDMQERGDLRQDETGHWFAGPNIQLDLLPPRVEGVIETRIERLDSDLREMLSVASVMGEEFTAEVVARVLQLEERLVIRQLAGTLNKQHHLVRDVGSRREGLQRLSQFRFRHNLFQNYLYQDLTTSERSYLHEDMGLVLEQLYAGRPELAAVQLAYHFQEAGAAERAVVYLILAGERAVQLSAYEEAAQHFNQALTLLTELPESAERQQQEFTVQFNLGKIWEAINGTGSQEAGEAYSRALALAHQLDDSRKIIQVLLVLTQSAQFRSEIEVAQSYAEESRRLAQEFQDPELLMLANQALLWIALGLGEHNKIVTYGDEVSAFYHTLSTLTFDDVYNLVRAMGMSSVSLVRAGYPDQGLQKAQEALNLAKEREHHFGTATAMGLLATVHIARGEYQEGVRFGEAMRDFSETHNFTLSRTFGELHKGGSLAMLGDVDTGIALVSQAIAERTQIGVSIADAGYIAMLGEACGLAGRVGQGLALVNEALAEIEVSNDRQNEPEIHRRKGDLLLLQDLAADKQGLAQQDAEACFRRSNEIAQSQGAKLWEARALAKLCRLLHSQGRDEGCRQQLAELYAWFSEGFETEDLQVVRAVLQEMD